MPTIIRIAVLVLGGCAVVESPLDAGTHDHIHLSIERAWQAGGVLTISARLTNAPFGQPAPVAPASFRIEGAASRPAIDGLGDARACRANVFVAPGASHVCELFFDARLPSHLTYEAPDGRSTFAMLLPCAAGSSAGLCTEGLCLDGRCVPPCGAGGTTCARVDDTCVAGACLPACSSRHPHGACPAGALCVRGACDASRCGSLARAECRRCARDEGCAAGLPCEGCADCPDGICGCRMQPACAVCDTRSFLACLRDRCGDRCRG